MRYGMHICSNINICDVYTVLYPSYHAFFEKYPDLVIFDDVDIITPESKIQKYFTLID